MAGWKETSRETSQQEIQELLHNQLILSAATDDLFTVWKCGRCGYHMLLRERCKGKWVCDWCRHIQAIRDSE